MSADLLKKWIAALRSGEYKQTVSSLRDDNGFCCLGVLEDILGCEWKLDYAYDYLCTRDGNEATCVLSSSPFPGLTLGGGIRGTSVELTELNDQGISFNCIANIIEEHFDILNTGSAQE